MTALEVFNVRKTRKNEGGEGEKKMEERSFLAGRAGDCLAWRLIAPLPPGADPPPHGHNGGQNGPRHGFDFANEFSPGC